MLRDEQLIIEARELADSMIAADPKLASYPALAREVAIIREEERSAFLDKG